MIRHGEFQQRVGTLIEKYICEKYNYFFNKRQQQKGYFDCYDDKQIFEIKAIKKQINRVTINIKNHKELLKQDGRYIVVNYDLINKDKGLSVISDIKILQIIKMDSLTVDSLLDKHGIPYERNYKGRVKQYTRLKLDYILEVNNG